MHIIEQYICGKHLADDCEDGIVSTDDFIAVIDGSTGKTTLRYRPDMTNGRRCMMLLTNLVTHLPAESTVEAFCQAATAVIARYYPAAHHDCAVVVPPHERLCASIIVYSRLRHEIWMIGDCRCMVDGVLYDNPKPDEERFARQRAALFASCMAQHPDMIIDGKLVHDYARDAILPELIDAMHDENITYAVIDGYPVYMPGVKIVPVPLYATDIVLASDGYPHLFPTLSDSEAALRQLLDNDPFCIKDFLATKGTMRNNISFDVRSYIRFTP